MGRSFNNIVYIIITILIIVGLIQLVGSLLPYILIALVVFWIYRFIKGGINNRKSRHDKIKYNNNVYTNNQHNEDGKVIDVDYEELNK